MENAIEQARTDPALRGMTPKIRQHFDTLHRRMRRRQKMWGGDLSVLDADSEKRSAAIRRSMAFDRVMREMPVTLEPYDLIVGSCCADDTVIRCALPIYIKNEELGLCSIQMSHKCPDYDTLLRRGLRAIIEELAARREDAQAEPHADVRAAKLDFIEACIREAEAVIALANRYAQLAETRAAAETDAARRAELLAIARVCRRVPEYPAGSLHEAVQSVWLFNYAMIKVYSNVSIGRIDQVLNPYFEADWKAGRITLEAAQALVDSFVLHVNDRAQIDPKQYYLEDQRALPGAPQQCRIGYGYGFVTALETDHADAINHWGQNILLSGLNPDGSDATNALTYLFLNAHEKFSMTSPVLTVRMHKNTPDTLLHRAAEVLKTGGGMPYINNDDVIIGGYERLGVPRADGCRYANSNCWETLLQGMSNQEMIRGLNFLYFLELALNRGQPFLYGEDLKKQQKPNRDDPMTFGASCCVSYDIAEGVDTGCVSEFSTFESLVRAWKIQLDGILSKAMEHVYREILKNGSHGPLDAKPLLSALTQDCVKNLTDLTHGGAKYTLWHLMGEAVANAADAMAAIRGKAADPAALRRNPKERLGRRGGRKPAPAVHRRRAEIRKRRRCRGRHCRGDDRLLSRARALSRAEIPGDPFLALHRHLFLDHLHRQKARRLGRRAARAGADRRKPLPRARPRYFRANSRHPLVFKAEHRPDGGRRADRPARQPERARGRSRHATHRRADPRVSPRGRQYDDADRHERRGAAPGHGRPGAVPRPAGAHGRLVRLLCPAQQGVSGNPSEARGARLRLTQ